MTVEMGVTAAVLLVLVVLLAREIVGPAAAILGALVLLVIVGVVCAAPFVLGWLASATGGLLAPTVTHLTYDALALAFIRWMPAGQAHQRDSAS